MKTKSGSSYGHEDRRRDRSGQFCRILRDITGDFDLRVRVAGTRRPGGRATTTAYSPYHGAGLIIWQDEENYVRLEIAADLQYGKVPLRQL